MGNLYVKMSASEQSRLHPWIFDLMIGLTYRAEVKMTNGVLVH